MHSQAQNNRVLIGFEAIGRDLKVALCRNSDLFCEGYCVALRAASEVPRENQLAVSLDCNERISISGNKIIGKGRLPTNNRACTALRMAASTLRTSQTCLGAQFRRLRTKLGAPIAIKAMAAKLARLVYGMLRHGKKYVDLGMAFYEAQQRHKQVHYLKRKAAELGFKIVEAPAA